jgi:prolipoprotein diacylglyceryltransferase
MNYLRTIGWIAIAVGAVSFLLGMNASLAVIGRSDPLAIFKTDASLIISILLVLIGAIILWYTRNRSSKL